MDTVGKVCVLLAALGYSVFEIGVSRINGCADAVRQRANERFFREEGQENRDPNRRVDTPTGVLTATDPRFDTQVRPTPAPKATTSGEFDDIVTAGSGELPDSRVADDGSAEASRRDDDGTKGAGAADGSAVADAGMTVVYSCFLTGMVGVVSLVTLWYVAPMSDVARRADIVDIPRCLLIWARAPPGLVSSLSITPPTARSSYVLDCLIASSLPRPCVVTQPTPDDLCMYVIISSHGYSQNRSNCLRYDCNV